MSKHIITALVTCSLVQSSRHTLKSNRSAHQASTILFSPRSAVSQDFIYWILFKFSSKDKKKKKSRKKYPGITAAAAGWSNTNLHLQHL